VRIGTRIALGLAAALSVTMGTAGMSWVGASESAETVRQVDETYDVLRAVDAVFEDLVDVETGARGYVIMGQPAFLDPFQHGEARWPDDLAALRRFVGDDPDDDPVAKELTEQLAAVGAQRLRIADETVAARRDAGAAAAAQVVASGRGKAAMDRARELVAAIRTAESARLVERLRTERSRIAAARALVVASALLLLGLASLVTVLLTRSVTRPLAVLAAAAERLGRGEPAAVPDARTDEIGDLARAFVAMVRARDAAEGRLRALIEQAPEPYFLSTPEARIVDVNDATCSMLGYSREELLGRRLFDLLPPPDAERLAEAWGRRAPAVVNRAEWTLCRKDGSTVPVEINARVLPDGHGQAFARDMTRHLQARQERERRLTFEQMHRRRLEMLRESVLRISTLRGASRRRDLLGSIVEEAKALADADHGAVGVGGDLGEGFHPDVSSGEPPGDAAVLLDVPIRSEGTSVGAFHLARAPGRAPFSEEDRTVVELLAGHAAIAIENARLYGELAAAVAAREELLAVVSHDLKNPLNAIVLHETILQRSANPAMVEHARVVKRAAMTMQRLIGDLLDSASLDAGQLRLDVAEGSVADIVEQVVEGLSPVADDRGVRLVVEVPGTLRACLDGPRMVQVLGNLVANAIKFTPRGGTVLVRGQERSGAVVLAVVDTGSGIAPEALPHVFERYYTSGRGGNGLGLHIARRLVEAHHGTITARSQPGEGSVFEITVPHCAAVAEPDGSLGLHVA